jgi:GR25 family glycosyltransferase involved in LPS biosynthesis
MRSSFDTITVTSFFLNLNRRPDRRLWAQGEFRREGVGVERISALDACNLEDARGWRNVGARACALGHRMAWRKARQNQQDRVIVFEDDVILKKGFLRQFAALALPADWQIFYFGCTLIDLPEVVAPGLVRITGRLWETHAMMVRASAFQELHQLLAPYSRVKNRPVDFPSEDTAIDNLLLKFHQRHPVYAAYPALAWQRESRSDIDVGLKRKWSDGGRQLAFPHITHELDAEMALRWPETVSGIALSGSEDQGTDAHNVVGPTPAPVNVANQTHPAVTKAPPVAPRVGEGFGCQEFKDYPKFCLNLKRRPDRKLKAWSAFRKNGLNVERLCAYDAAGVTKSKGWINPGHRACALGHRKAWQKAHRLGAKGVIVFEDDVVFAPDFAARWAHLELPLDWQIFYLGCLFGDPGPELAQDGLLKVTGPTWDAHAYVVKAEVWPAWQKALASLATSLNNHQDSEPTACDMVMASFHDRFPAYSIWPPLAWQQSGLSNNEQATKANYLPDGRQAYRQEAIAHLPWPFQAEKSLPAVIGK